MAVQAEIFAVGTTAVAIASAPSDSKATVYLTAASSNLTEINLGPSSVTATGGFPVPTTNNFQVELFAGETLYAISQDSSTWTINVLVTGA
jgi:hypothetical protein